MSHLHVLGPLTNTGLRGWDGVWTIPLFCKYGMELDKQLGPLPAALGEAPSDCLLRRTEFARDPVQQGMICKHLN